MSNRKSKNKIFPFSTKSKKNSSTTGNSIPKSVPPCSINLFPQKMLVPFSNSNRLYKSKKRNKTLKQTNPILKMKEDKVRSDSPTQKNYKPNQSKILQFKNRMYKVFLHPQGTLMETIPKIIVEFIIIIKVIIIMLI